MKTTVTFETAIALRDAGFPQPEPAFGQFWYDAGAGVWVVGESGLLVFRSLSSRAEIDIADMDMSGIVFAPQAHDILAELESDFDISCLQDKNWMVICRNAADQPISYFTEPNPHEAAAKAYLQLHNPA